jgi:hypothetical protein
MIPVESNTSISIKDGCTPVSSTCVVWNGPDIPCIDLCKGDSIQKVVYELATQLCEISEGVLDVSTLDFDCLVGQGQSDPETILETLQLIIDKTCQNATGGGTGGGGTTPILPIALPACLYYSDDGDIITQLLPAQYSRYLADKICQNLLSIASLQSSVTTLNTRVTALELSAGGGQNPNEINIVSNCASAPNPGQTVSIQSAFTAFEGKFCELQSYLGNNAQLSTAINKECLSLDSSPQVANDSLIMSQLNGWVINPTNISQTIVNMWLTLCDVRTAVATQLNTAPPCLLISPFNLQITALTLNGFTATWNLPPLAGSQAPLGYSITILEWSGVAAIGQPIATASVGPNVTSYAFTGITAEASQFYQVSIKAVYSCGETQPLAVIGNIRLTSVQYWIALSDVVTNGSAQAPCLGNNVESNFPAIGNTLTVTLLNPSTNAQVNNIGAPISVIARITKTGDCVLNATENVTITIPTGQSTGTYNYFSQRYVKCGLDDCSVEYSFFTCAVSISSPTAIFAPTMPVCST